MSQQLLQYGPDVPTWSPAPSTLDGMEQAGPYSHSEPPGSGPVERVAFHSRERKMGPGTKARLVPSFPPGVTPEEHARPGYSMVYALALAVPGYVLHVTCKGVRLQTRDRDLFVRKGTPVWFVGCACGERVTVKGETRWTA